MTITHDIPKLPIPLIQFRFKSIFADSTKQLVEDSRLSMHLTRLGATDTKLTLHFKSSLELFSCINDTKQCSYILIEFHNSESERTIQKIEYKVANPKIIPIVSLDYGKNDTVESTVIFEIENVNFKGNI